MARYVTHPTRQSLFGGAVTAGIIGAVLFDAFLLVIHAIQYPGTYQLYASGIFGPGAFNDVSFAWVGIVLHFLVAIVAAIVYAYAAQIFGLLSKPIISGIIFGVVMNAIMDLILFGKGMEPLPSGWPAIGVGLAAHVIFYGIPVAWYLARYERVAIPYTNR
jgi:hypothetical protein